MADTRANRSTGKHVIYLNDKVNSSYVKKTYTNFKFTEDLQQDIIIPSFDGWSECNLVCFANDTIGKRWYWITAVSRTSAVSGALMLTLVIDPIATALKGGPTVSGEWDALPTATYPLKVRCVSGVEVPTDNSRVISENIIVLNNTSYYLGWVTLSVSKCCNEDWSSGTGTYTRRLTAQGGYNIYGFPVILDEANGTIADVGLKLQDEFNTFYCITLSEILNGPITSDYFGFTTDDIVDISISAGIPFDIDTDEQTENGKTYGIIKLIKKRSYTEGTPSTYYHFLRPNTNLDGRAYYKISGKATNESSADFVSSVNWGVPLVVPYPDAECRIVINDYMGNNISEIPPEYIPENNNGYAQLSIGQRIIFDYNGMVRRLTVSNPTTKQQLIINISEPHLPYIGTAWESYKAYSMNSDRDALISNIGFGIASSTAGAVGGALTGGAVGGTAGGMIGINVGTQAGQGVIGIAQQVYGQKLKERSVRRQPAQPIASGYGIQQILSGLMNPPAITVYRPQRFSETVFNEYVAKHGYPAEGTKDITFNADAGGYYEGAIYTGLTVSGPLMDELNNVLMQGCIITVDNSTDDPPTAGSSTS